MGPEAKLQRLHLKRHGVSENSRLEPKGGVEAHERGGGLELLNTLLPNWEHQPVALCPSRATLPIPLSSTQLFCNLSYTFHSADTQTEVPMTTCPEPQLPPACTLPVSKEKSSLSLPQHSLSSSSESHDGTYLFFPLVDSAS